MRRRGRRRSRRRGRPLAWGPLLLVGLLVAAALGFAGLEACIRPLAIETAAIEAKKFATETVQTAVQQELAKEGAAYAQLVHIARGEDGAVRAISSDAAAQSALQARLTLAVQRAAGVYKDVGVAAGTLTGWALLHGRGPKVPLRITLNGSARAQILSNFDSAGVNQTRHRLTLRMTVELCTFLMGDADTRQISVDVPLAETIIVGEVPYFMVQK